MKIETIDIYKFFVPLIHPIRVPLGVLAACENVLVRINTDSGIFGWGEASPFAPITGDSQDSCFEMAKTIARAIKGKDPTAVEERMREVNAVTVGHPSIRSAFDMALYDILGKAAGLPLYAVLGGEKREFRTDLTIGMQDTVEQTVSRARDIIGSGFDAIKLKVGRAGRADVEHVAAVRELVGPDIHIKIDSNQGWDYPTACAALRAMEPLDIQYSEQPLAAWDYSGLKRLRDNVAQAICADESVFDHHDAFKLVSMEAVDYLNIKLGKSGGITTALKIDAIAVASGRKCMVGCFAESRIGLTAAAHLASARPNIVFVDLDSSFVLAEDPAIGGITFDDKVGGLIHLTDAPGLGVDVKPEFLRPESACSV